MSPETVCHPSSVIVAIICSEFTSRSVTGSYEFPSLMGEGLGERPSTCLVTTLYLSMT